MYIFYFHTLKIFLNFLDQVQISAHKQKVIQTVDRNFFLNLRGSKRKSRKIIQQVDPRSGIRQNYGSNRQQVLVVRVILRLLPILQHIELLARLHNLFRLESELFQLLPQVLGIFVVWGGKWVATAGSLEEESVLDREVVVDGWGCVAFGLFRFGRSTFDEGFVGGETMLLEMKWFKNLEFF